MRLERNQYAALGFIVVMLCMVSCLSYVLLSDIMNTTESPTYVSASGDVSYNTYDESSTESVCEFILTSSEGEESKIVLIIRENIPVDYDCIGDYEIGDHNTKMYFNGITTVYMEDKNILRVDHNMEGATIHILRSDLCNDTI